jgi:hypothetical protein
MKQLHIVTAYTSNISDLSNLSYDSLTKYCSKHNISYERCDRGLLIITK